jgi:hypothetical protein
MLHPWIGYRACFGTVGPRWAMTWRTGAAERPHASTCPSFHVASAVDVPLPLAPRCNRHASQPTGWRVSRRKPGVLSPKPGPAGRLAGSMPCIVGTDPRRHQSWRWSGRRCAPDRREVSAGLLSAYVLVQTKVGKAGQAPRQSWHRRRATGRGCSRSPRHHRPGPSARHGRARQIGGCSHPGVDGVSRTLTCTTIRW